MQGIIYVVTNIVTGKRYVGQTKGAVLTRWAQHLAAARGTSRKPSVLHAAIRKYGPDAWRLDVLGEADSQAELDEREAAAIVAFGSLVPGGYNLRAGGNVAQMHAETRRKLSLVRTGRKLTPEHRANIGAGQKGRKLSVDQVEQIRAARTGKPLSAEHRAKLSAAGRGRPRTASQLAAMLARAAAAKGKPGRPPGVEARRKMSDARTGVPKKPESIAKTAAANRGKVRSAETRRMIAEAARRRAPASAETRQKMSEAQRRRFARRDALEDVS